MPESGDRSNSQAFFSNFNRKSTLTKTFSNEFRPSAGGNHFDVASHVTPTWNKLSVVGSENNESIATPSWNNKQSATSESLPTFMHRPENINRTSSMQEDPPLGRIFSAHAYPQQDKQNN